MPRGSALVAAVVAACLVLATPAPVIAAPSEPPLRAITWNVCGAACAWGDEQPLAAQAAHAVRAYNADILFLQEACAPQFAAVRAALPGYTGTFKAQLRSGRCGGSNKHGIAVFVRGTATNARWWNIGGTEGLTGTTYFLLAVDGRTAAGRRYTAATVHLRVKCDAEYDYDDCAPLTHEARTEQAEAITDELDPLVRAGVPVVIGGDFNMLPGSSPMSMFYGPTAGGTGLFVEADGGLGRTGESTVCDGEQKIDFVFYSRPNFGFVDGDAANCADDPVSDHKLLRATATWR